MHPLAIILVPLRFKTICSLLILQWQTPESVKKMVFVRQIVVRQIVMSHSEPRGVVFP